MFYERLCELCKENNTNPTALAKAIGISTGNVTNWNNGREPKTSLAIKIANYFGVSVEYLMGETDNRLPVAKISDDDIKFALFGGDGEVTDEMYEEIKAFAEFVKNKHKNKKD